jgi:hypothetical protein
MVRLGFEPTTLGSDFSINILSVLAISATRLHVYGGVKYLYPFYFVFGWFLKAWGVRIACSKIYAMLFWVTSFFMVFVWNRTCTQRKLSITSELFPPEQIFVQTNLLTTNNELKGAEKSQSGKNQELNFLKNSLKKLSVF